MSFEVTVRRFDNFAKVEVTELDSEGNPKDGREWYSNINIDGVDLEHNPIQLPDGLIEAAYADLMAKRAATIAQERTDAALSEAVIDALDGLLPV